MSELEGAPRVHISAKPLSLQKRVARSLCNCNSIIAEVLVVTDARLSYDAQTSFISDVLSTVWTLDGTWTFL